MWTRQGLKELVQGKLTDSKIIIVANRQPVAHVWRKGQVVAQRGIGGVVTALEPIILTCGGTWVALSDGEADRVAADVSGSFQVETHEGRYALKRVWVEKEIREGYYYGFANNALWPLCHTVYQRPVFRQEDWEQYCEVNRRFAQAIVEVARHEKALVLIQDYHFVRLAWYLKNMAPGQFITAHFWHIPFPAFEVFRICPQKEAILQGLLSNDLLGFHTRYHCQNFMDVVDRTLVSKIDREVDVIQTAFGRTQVKAYPISIDPAMSQITMPESEDFLQNLLSDGVRLDQYKLFLGVDRIDYTKGLPEKLKAFNQMLLDHPELKGKVILLQIGVLSRMHLAAYKHLNDEINAIVEEINWRHSQDGWKPVHFIRRTLNPKELAVLYRQSDVGVVGPLHDGMNLVAKEYVLLASEKSALVLSQFAGAARELTDAVLVNPYDRNQYAQALYTALTMDDQEKATRHRKMFTVVEQNNVYRWAGKMLADLLKLDVEE